MSNQPIHKTFISRILMKFGIRLPAEPVHVIKVSLTLEEGHRLRVFENRVLRIISGSNRQELIGDGKKFIMKSFITFSSSRKMG
jgi:hypothetical protein